MREITSHRVNPVNDAVIVEVVDEKGAGGAHHNYRLTYPGRAMQIEFQNGPINEAGVNGVTHEALIAVLIDRLECFQQGPYACEENAQALNHLRMAQGALLSRTKARMERGVEGTHAL